MHLKSSLAALGTAVLASAAILPMGLSVGLGLWMSATSCHARWSSYVRAVAWSWSL